MLSQFSGEANDQTLADYIDKPGFYAAGRLDKNSEGLLLLTNDGRLQHQLTDPKFNKLKYYWVQVEGIPSPHDLLALRNGLTVNGVRYLPAIANIIAEPEGLWPRNPPIRFRKHIPTSWLEIILSEGKNHQVRKMTAAINYPTLRLIRHRIADWCLEDLKPGEYKLIELSRPLH